MESTRSLITDVYAAFNRRDIDGALALMSEQVDWPKASEGGHIIGKDEIRAYWTRQWAVIAPRVQPVEFSTGPEGEVIVEVHQVVHDLDGNLLADKMVGHIFRIEKGLVKRFDIRGS